jgi:hypothetical protein
VCQWRSPKAQDQARNMRGQVPDLGEALSNIPLSLARIGVSVVMTFFLLYFDHRSSATCVKPDARYAFRVPLNEEEESAFFDVRMLSGIHVCFFGTNQELVC